jgi:hypothetical protein
MRLPLFLVLGLGLSGCASWLPAPVPMRAVDHERPGPRATCLLVLLPGGGDHEFTFARRGIVDAIQARGYSIDIVAADASLGYYARGQFAKRLADDVVLRRSARGYKQLWLLGPSLGGFGALLYSRQRPAGEVSGVLELSPFLGNDRKLLGSIEQHGLANWRPPPRAAKLDEDNYVPELWRWLQALTENKAPGPALYLGYGRDEWLAKPDGLLAAALPRDHVFVTPGGHNWQTWHALIDEFLDRGPLANACK